MKSLEQENTILVHVLVSIQSLFHTAAFYVESQYTSVDQTECIIHIMCVISQEDSIMWIAFATIQGHLANPRVETTFWAYILLDVAKSEVHT